MDDPEFPPLFRDPPPEPPPPEPYRKEPALARYRRALRRPDQLALDALFTPACGKADAAFQAPVYRAAAGEAEPPGVEPALSAADSGEGEAEDPGVTRMELYLMAMLVEERKQVLALRKRVARLLR